MSSPSAASSSLYSEGPAVLFFFLFLYSLLSFFPSFNRRPIIGLTRSANGNMDVLTTQCPDLAVAHLGLYFTQRMTTPNNARAKVQWVAWLRDAYGLDEVRPLVTPIPPEQNTLSKTRLLSSIAISMLPGARSFASSSPRNTPFTAASPRVSPSGYQIELLRRSGLSTEQYFSRKRAASVCVFDPSLLASKLT